MPRKLKDTELDTATARGRLAPRRDPYWRRISRTCHLGYRRNRTGAGTWVGRFYNGERYVEEMLGTVDDYLPANGASVLSFDQAQARAREWFAAQERKVAGLEDTPSGPYTVTQCMADYLSWYADHRKALTETRATIGAHILPTFGGREVESVTASQIRKWHQALAASPARVRSAKGQPLRTRDAQGADEQRSRKATANRVLTTFKAALNHAYAAGCVRSDEAWRRVKPFRKVESPKIRYLAQDELARLCNACEPDFRRLVQGALLSGGRYGELVCMKVNDYNRDAGALRVCDSKSGEPRHIFLNGEGISFFEQVTAGRPGNQRMFLRQDGGPWGKSHQARRLEAACRTAAIEPVSFHILRHTYASQLAMRGVPMPVIAQQLGHADIRMTLKHYAHLAPSYVADVVRSSLPVFGIVEPLNVAHFWNPAR